MTDTERGREEHYTLVGGHRIERMGTIALGQGSATF